MQDGKLYVALPIEFVGEFKSQLLEAGRLTNERLATTNAPATLAAGGRQLYMSGRVAGSSGQSEVPNNVNFGNAMPASNAPSGSRQMSVIEIRIVPREK